MSQGSAAENRPTEDDSSVPLDAHTAEDLAQVEKDLKNPPPRTGPRPRRRRSVRAPLVHHAYSSLRVVCPYGHLLGKVTKNSDHFVVGRGLSTDQDVAEEHRKLRADCRSCREEGRRPDYQSSWQRARERLTELDANPLVGVAEYVLGGKRLQ